MVDTDFCRNICKADDAIFDSDILFLVENLPVGILRVWGLKKIKLTKVSFIADTNLKIYVI